MSTGAIQSLSETPSNFSHNKAGVFYVMLTILFAALWAIPITRNVDLPNWHEFDDAAIARNFVQEPSSILYPRIDWRKDGPGFVESEFPLYPWLMSKAYEVGGVNVTYGRVLSWLATIGSLLIFIRLARLLLPEVGALTAVVLFGANRVVNFVSTALQPEAFMLFFYLAAIYAFIQWRATRSRLAYALTIVAVSLAILEKSPSAHLGIFFLLVMVSEQGWGFLKSPAVWGLAIFSLIIPIAWYGHAHSLWITYGNSLGISNENHWIDWDVLKSLRLPVGLAIIEGLFVFGLGGLLLAVLSVATWRSQKIKLILFWLVSIVIYFAITIRTTGAFWAWYYHIVSVAPMALLCGAGAALVLQAAARMRYIALGAIGSAAALWLLIAGAGHIKQTTGSAVINALTLGQLSVLQNVVLIGCCVLLVWLLARSSSTTGNPANPISTIVCAAGISGYLFLSAHLIGSDLTLYKTPSPELLSAKQFSALIPENNLILASGGICGDSYGHKAASDAPQMFYWLNRKGFSICVGEQTLDNVQATAKRGARYFVAEKSAVNEEPGFEEQLRSHFNLLAEGPAAWLFDLQHQKQPSLRAPQ